MRKTFIFSVGLILSAFACATTKPQKTAPAMPSGVNTNAWVPLGDSIGFVITAPVTNATETVDYIPVVHGYYMINISNTWYRTSPEDNPHPAIRLPFRGN